MKNKFSFVSDLIFFFLASFVISVVVFNYLCAFPFSVMLSLMVALLTVMLLYSRSKKENAFQKLKKQEKKELLELANHLNFCTLKEQNLIMENALIKSNLTVEKKSFGLRIKDKKTLIIMKFGFNKVSKADVVRAFNHLLKGENAYIIAESFLEEVTAFASRFNDRIFLVSVDKLYRYLKSTNTLPTARYTEFMEKKKKGDFRILLDRKKAKNFLGFGIFFLFMSYFSPVKLYYVLFGCAFIIYSVVLRTFGKDLTAKT